MLKLLSESRIEVNGVVYQARPILFKPFMIREIVRGKKTETRRLVKTYGEKCRLGAAGDVLYVKETYHKFYNKGLTRKEKFSYKTDATPSDEEYRLKCIKKGYDYKWKSGLFMPRVAARYWLRIKSVDCEKLGEIMNSDAKREGFRNRNDFIQAWNTINPGLQYADNVDSRVWIIRFRMFYTGNGVVVKGVKLWKQLLLRKKVI